MQMAEYPLKVPTSRIFFGLIICTSIFSSRPCR